MQAWPLFLSRERRRVCLNKLTKKESKVSRSENDEVIETLGADGPHESFCVGVAVWAACWDWGITQESSVRIEKIPRDLHQPTTVRVNPDARDVDGPSLEFDDEEDHVSDRAEHAQVLDCKEVARVEYLPVAPEKLLPGPLVLSFRCWLDPSLRQDICHCCATYLDFQTAKSISDLPAIEFPIERK